MLGKTISVASRRFPPDRMLDGYKFFVGIMPPPCHVSVMLDRSSKRPRDPNQLAKLMVGIASGDASGPPSRLVSERKKDPAAVALGRKGGLKGGLARASKMSPEERSLVARNAAAARWRRKDNESE